MLLYVVGQEVKDDEPAAPATIQLFERLLPATVLVTVRLRFSLLVWA